jgi:hypothetical protein
MREGRTDPKMTWERILTLFSHLKTKLEKKIYKNYISHST